MCAPSDNTTSTKTATIDLVVSVIMTSMLHDKYDEVVQVLMESSPEAHAIVQQVDPAMLVELIEHAAGSKIVVPSYVIAALEIRVTALCAVLERVVGMCRVPPVRAPQPVFTLRKRGNQEDPMWCPLCHKAMASRSSWIRHMNTVCGRQCVVQLTAKEEEIGKIVDGGAANSRKLPTPIRSMIAPGRSLVVMLSRCHLVMEEELRDAVEKQQLESAVRTIAECHHLAPMDCALTMLAIVLRTGQPMIVEQIEKTAISRLEEMMELVTRIENVTQRTEDSPKTNGTIIEVDEAVNSTPNQVKTLKQVARSEMHKLPTQCKIKRHRRRVSKRWNHRKGQRR